LIGIPRIQVTKQQQKKKLRNKTNKDNQMQIINTWPEGKLLVLPEQVKTALIQHLAQPFQNNQAQAKAYWLEHKPLLIILDKEDQLNLRTTTPLLAPATLLNDTFQHKLEVVLENPEYTEEFIENYQISLAIFSDAGDGIYCVMPVI